MTIARIILFPAFFSPSFATFGNRVVSSLGEGITTQDPPNSESETNEKAAFSECLNGIG